jgi:hypothetical protein
VDQPIEDAPALERRRPRDREINGYRQWARPVGDHRRKRKQIGDASDDDGDEMNIHSGNVLGRLFGPMFGVEARIFRLGKKVSHGMEEECSWSARGILDASRTAIVNYYLPRVITNPPEAFLGQFPSDEPTEEDARKWLIHELDAVILDASRTAIVNYYLPRVITNPPEAFLGQFPSDEPTEEDARKWLIHELDAVFPGAEQLIKEMELDVTYKDLTFEIQIPSWNPLRHTEFATIRLRLLKIARRIIEHASRIRIALASCCPEAETFSLVALKLQPSGP